MTVCLAPSSTDPRHACPLYNRLTLNMAIGKLAAQSDCRKYHYCAEVGGKVLDCPDIPRLARETGLDRNALRLVFKRHGTEGRAVDGILVWRAVE